MLRPAQCVQEGGGPVRRAGGSQHFTHFQEVRFRRTADVFHHVRRIAGNVRFQQVPHATRMAQRGIAFREAFFIQLIVPGCFIVLTFFGVIAGKQAVVETVIFTHDQAGVGVRLNIFTVEFVVG